MANGFRTDTNLSAYNYYSKNDNPSVFQPRTYLLSFKVCELKRDRQRCIHIDSYPSDTIEQLKGKIAMYLNITVPVNKFFLEIFDERQNKWKKIGNEDSAYTIRQLNLLPGSLISVEYYAYETLKAQSSSYSTSPYNDQHELTLKLCTEPMNRTNFEYLYILSSSTLGELRKQAYEKLNKLAKNRPIFQWNKDHWMSFEFELDNCLLASLNFESYAFISIEYDENNSNSTSVPGLCGLVNLGSTCFMNSVFQCLSNIPEFTQKILAFNKDVNAPIIGEYIQLIKQIWSGKYERIDPSLLVDNISEHLPRYTTYRQQDAQEFMNHFLHLIHAELSTKDTLITELFYGHIQSTVKCLECKTNEITNESISFLPLPISNHIRNSHNLKTIRYIKTDGEQRLVSIEIDSYVFQIRDLIDYFIKQQKLTLNREQIAAYRLVNNCIEESYRHERFIGNIRDEELVFFECPEKLSQDVYQWCNFLEYSTGKAFRPPVVLAGPIYTCRYSDISDQINQLFGHLCSMTGATVSACRLAWKDRNNEQYKLSIETNTDESLPHWKCIIIELATEWVDIYKQHYNFNDSIDNSRLSSLLNDFFREDQLDGDYQCLKCSKRTKARQKSDLYLPLPHVLIIQLKRFTYDNYSNDKIDKFISFPLNNLDLNQYIIKDDSKKSENNSSTKYDLVAISNHTGSLSSGHYTTHAKNTQDNNWYSFDDRIVRKLDSDDIITKNAYILVYVQQTNEKSS